MIKRNYLKSPTYMFYAMSRIYQPNLEAKVGDYLWDNLHWKLFFTMTPLADKSIIND
jgi:hypothetical protein